MLLFLRFPGRYWIAGFMSGNNGGRNTVINYYWRIAARGVACKQRALLQRVIWHFWHSCHRKLSFARAAFRQHLSSWTTSWIACWAIFKVSRFKAKSLLQRCALSRNFYMITTLICAAHLFIYAAKGILDFNGQAILSVHVSITSNPNHSSFQGEYFILHSCRYSRLCFQIFRIALLPKKKKKKKNRNKKIVSCPSSLIREILLNSLANSAAVLLLLTKGTK